METFFVIFLNLCQNKIEKKKKTQTDVVLVFAFSNPVHYSSCKEAYRKTSVHFSLALEAFPYLLTCTSPVINLHGGGGAAVCVIFLIRFFTSSSRQQRLHRSYLRALLLCFRHRLHAIRCGTWLPYIFRWLQAT